MKSLIDNRCKRGRSGASKQESKTNSGCSVGLSLRRSTTLVNTRIAFKTKIKPKYDAHSSAWQ
jgi:hypothetical protein